MRRRASRFNRNPGVLTFQKLEGPTPSERRDAATMKTMFIVLLGGMLLTMIPIALLAWFVSSLGPP